MAKEEEVTAKPTEQDEVAAKEEVTAKPTEQEVVAAKEEVLVFNPDTEEVTAKPVAKRVKTGGAQATFRARELIALGGINTTTLLVNPADLLSLVDMVDHAAKTIAFVEPKAFEEGVFVVEAAVNPAHGPVDAAFLVATGITVTWADCIAVKVIEQAATVTGVETCSGEVFAILDVGGATEPYFP